MGLVRVASGVVSALQTGCISSAQALVGAIAAGTFNDDALGGAGDSDAAGGSIGSADELVSGGSASEELSGDELTDAELRGDMGRRQVDDLLDGLDLDLDPDDLLRAILAALGAAGLHVDPRRTGQLSAVYASMVCTWLVSMVCKWLLTAAMAIDPARAWLVLAERNLHMGLGAALVRGLSLLLPALVLLLRLPWLRSLVLMLRHEAVAGGWWQWQGRSRQGRELQQQRGSGSGPELEAERVPHAAGAGLTPSAPNLLHPIEEGAPPVLVGRQQASSSQGERVRDASCSDVQDATALHSEGEQTTSRSSDSAAASSSCSAVDSQAEASGAAAAMLSRPGPGVGPAEAAGTSSAPSGTDGRRSADGWHGRPPESRFAVNVLRTAALLCTSVAAALLPSNRSASWLLTVVDLAAAGATALVALAAFVEVWRDDDRGYLFGNDAERALRLAFSLLLMRAGIEIAFGIMSEKWMWAWLSVSACCSALISCVYTELEPSRAYLHLFHAAMPILGCMTYIKIVM